MRESTDNFAGLDLRRRRTFHRLFDERGEVLLLAVLSCDMAASRESRSASRPEAILVGCGRRHDAVRRHQDRPVELLELLPLLPPRIAVVACEVRILLEGRIIMGRKHLGMGIDIDARASSLFKQHLKVAQIVPRNQDAGIVPNADIDLRDLRAAVGGRIRLVEESHARDAELTSFNGKCDEIVHRKRIVKRRRERALDERIHLIVILHERIRVFRVGGESLESVGYQLAQRADVLVCGRKYADLFSDRSDRIYKIGCESLFRFSSLDNRGLDCIGVEIRVRDRDEEIDRHEVVDGLVDGLVLLAHRRRDLSEKLGLKDQLILQGGDVRRLSAHAAHRAALVSCRLLALPAKHLLFHFLCLLFSLCRRFPCVGAYYIPPSSSQHNTRCVASSGKYFLVIRW